MRLLIIAYYTSFYIIFTIIFIAISQYMKTRLGLKPEEYSKEERKYDELKEIEKV